MRTFLFIILIFTLQLKAQDKLFFMNGTSINCSIISIAKNVVYYKQNDTSALQQVDKSTLVMAENREGVRFIFYNADTASTTKATTRIKQRKKFIGSATLCNSCRQGNGSV